MAAPALTLRSSTALAWRTLRSMRTALVLLLLLALASVAGSLVPQVGVAEARIAATFRDHPLRARIYEQLGLFDVYGSWWFTLLYVLLLVSLGACLLPRTRALVRNLRARPSPARELDGLRHYAEVSVGEDPDRAIAGARRLLRRRRFRVHRADGRPALAADKGLAREAGSLLFHWSFFLLLIGIVWGKGTGFTGTAVVVEGQTWVEAHANYDGTVREGRFFGEDHSGIRLEVEEFRATYRPTGQPEDFVTVGRLSRADGSVAREVEIRVNEPAVLDGVRFYQFGYGWAPVVEVERDGEPIASAPIVCTQATPPTGVSRLQLPWDCVLKLPSLRPQLALELVLWPDSRSLYALLDTGTAMPMFRAFAPVMTYRLYRGDLGLGSPQRTTVLDTSRMREVSSGAIGAGETVDLGDGVTMRFADLREYTVLQVGRDRGLWIVLLAAILLLVGLLPALYSSRRKLWVSAEPHDGGAMLKVGGFALHRRSQFEEEFARLVAELRRSSREEARA